MYTNEVYRFKIRLKGIKPMIWRRIEVPSDFTFWELNYAVIDSMGWEGYHFSEFIMKNPASGIKERIVFPDSEMGPSSMSMPEKKIADYFTLHNKECSYIYDFGDNWEHVIKLEDIHPADENTVYPVCTGGKRACPPEDCGGIGGYYDLLEILEDPDDPEHEEMKGWVGEDFDPQFFDKSRVFFRDANVLLKRNKN